jgi:phage antirepressor YoqD-like protein
MSRLAVSTWVLISTHYIKIKRVLDVNDAIDMNQKAEKTMSSREIAELTGKSHRNVTRDISVMCDDLEIDCSNLSSDYIAGNGQVYREFNLNRELTDCLLTGYSANLRMAVIKRWRELEQQVQALPDFTNPAEAAIAWAKQYKRAEVLQLETKQALKQIEDDAPKVEFYSAVGDADDLYQLSEVVKALQLDFGRNTAFKMLRDSNVLLKGRGVKNDPSQSFVNRGIFKVKKVLKEGQPYKTTMVTGKGVIWLYNFFVSRANLLDVKDMLGMETGK